MLHKATQHKNLFKASISHFLMAVDVELPSFKLPKLKDLPALTKKKLREYSRVLGVTKKPSIPEFKAVSKVTGIGIAIIGLTGFVIFMVAQLFM